MTIQNYLMVSEVSNIVENVIVWNGDVNSWQPPNGYLMLPVQTTPAVVWLPVKENDVVIDYVLTEVMGAGSINDTWDGSVLITNEPKPIFKSSS